MFILRADHYVDSPADVIVLETSVKANTKINMANGMVKQLYPGWYDRVKDGMYHNAKLNSIFVCESEIPIPDRGRKLAIAGVCVYSPACPSPTPAQSMDACDSLFSWFWSQDRYKSIGMNLIGIRRRGMISINSCIQDHEKLWKQYQGKKKDRELYLHSVESSYIAPIQAQRWEGPFVKVTLWRPLFPQLESNK